METRKTYVNLNTNSMDRKGKPKTHPKRHIQGSHDARAASIEVCFYRCPLFGVCAGDVSSARGKFFREFDRVGGDVFNLCAGFGDVVAADVGRYHGGNGEDKADGYDGAGLQGVSLGCRRKRRQGTREDERRT